ncbi:cytosine/uracil/thiamine/allantoin permease [Nocardia sp. GAS34]
MLVDPATATQRTAFAPVPQPAGEPPISPRLLQRRPGADQDSGTTMERLQHLHLWASDVHSLGNYGFALGLSTLGWITFGALWLVQIILFTMTALAVWVLMRAHGSIAWSTPAHLTGGAMWREILAGAALWVSVYSTFVLNFCDFTRACRTRRSIDIVHAIPNTALLVAASLALLILTIAVNLMANFVAPIYALTNLFPERLNFARAGLVSAVIGVVI